MSPASQRPSDAGLLKGFNGSAESTHPESRIPAPRFPANGSVLRRLSLRWIMAFITSWAVIQPLLADTFDVPVDGSTLVGRVKVVVPRLDNTLLDIARQLDVGHHEITLANPGVDVWVPRHDENIVVPSRYILPPKPWKGIIINIPQRRLFYFPEPLKGKPAKVMTYPVSIAREGWSTPLGESTVLAAHKDPAWFVPKSIREEHRKAGDVDFPEYFPPGPDNPMGMLAIQTGFPGIFIHGTNRPWGVGMRTSHGCLHLYPEDAAEIFPLMKRGIPVRVIDQPFVVGTDGREVFLTSHEPVAEYPGTRNLHSRAVLAVSEFIAADQKSASPRFDVDWDKVEAAAKTLQPVPVSVARGAKPLKQVLDDIVPDIYNFEPYGVDANDASMPGQ
jgi:L,D-transpeptidase ErfK/SrfK